MNNEQLEQLEAEETTTKMGICYVTEKGVNHLKQYTVGEKVEGHISVIEKMISNGWGTDKPTAKK